MKGTLKALDLLKKRIVEDGRVIGDDILKVDMFLNHQIDVGLLQEIGKEFKRRFADTEVTKILTIEASGIGIACITARKRRLIKGEGNRVRIPDGTAAVCPEAEAR